MRKKIRNEKLKIVIIDDHPAILEGVSSLLKNDSNLEIVGLSQSIESGLKEILKNKPSLIITDISIQTNLEGIEFIKALRKRFSKIKILAYSMHIEPVIVEKAIQAGANGFISKQECTQNILQAISEIRNGKFYISERISRTMAVNSLNKNDKNSDTNIWKLSARELEIFSYIGEGVSTQGISKNLCLSVSTIESHRANIKKKLQFRTNSELVKNAVIWRTAF